MNSGFDPDISIEVKFTRGQRPAESRAQTLCFAMFAWGYTQYLLHRFRFAIPGAETDVVRQSREHKVGLDLGWTQCLRAGVKAN